MQGQIPNTVAVGGRFPRSLFRLHSAERSEHAGTPVPELGAGGWLEEPERHLEPTVFRRGHHRYSPPPCLATSRRTLVMLRAVCGTPPVAFVTPEPNSGDSLSLPGMSQ